MTAAVKTAPPTVTAEWINEPSDRDVPDEGGKCEHCDQWLGIGSGDAIDPAAWISYAIVRITHWWRGHVDDTEPTGASYETRLCEGCFGWVGDVGPVVAAELARAERANEI